MVNSTVYHGIELKQSSRSSSECARVMNDEPGISSMSLSTDECEMSDDCCSLSMGILSSRFESMWLSAKGERKSMRAERGVSSVRTFVRVMFGEMLQK